MDSFTTITLRGFSHTISPKHSISQLTLLSLYLRMCDHVLAQAVTLGCLVSRNFLPSVSQRPAMLTSGSYMGGKHNNVCKSYSLDFPCTQKAEFQKGHLSVLWNQSPEGIDAAFKRNRSSRRVLMLCWSEHQQAGKSVIQNEIIYAPIKDYLFAK